MAKGFSLAAIALLGSLAACMLPTLAGATDDVETSGQRIVVHRNSRTVTRTELDQVSVPAFSPALARAAELNRPTAKRPSIRGPIVPTKGDCESHRIPEIHAKDKICSFGAYAKSSLRPGATDYRLIDWIQVAIRPINDWCLTRVAGYDQVYTSKVISSTPDGLVKPGVRRARVRMVDEDGHGSGRMSSKSTLPAGQLRGQIEHPEKGDKARWKWTGRIHKKTLRIAAGSAVSVPATDDGLIIGVSGLFYTTVPCRSQGKPVSAPSGG
jgi:hypothetical protein